MTVLDRHSALPLWAQVLDDLRGRLQTGEFEDRFPTDAELTALYGVSRQTVRQALEHLRQNGVIERQRGRGSRVVDPALEQVLGGYYSLARTIEASGLDERSQVLAAEITTDEAAASHLELRPTTRLVHVARLRFAGGEAIAVDRSWLPARIGRPLLRADLTEGSLYELLAERCRVRVTSGRERIRPVLPTRGDAALLQLRGPEPALQIERIVLAGHLPVEWRVSVTRGDRFVLVSEWSRSGL